MTTRDSERPTYIWEQSKRERDQIGDHHFIMTMRLAIARKQENPPIGIDHRPCTRNPRFVAHRPRPLVRVTSREDTS